MCHLQINVFLCFISCEHAVAQSVTHMKQKRYLGILERLLELLVLILQRLAALLSERLLFLH